MSTHLTTQELDAARAKYRAKRASEKIICKRMKGFKK
jgi:hypothetical protein